MSSISDAPTTDAPTTDAPTQSSEIDPSISGAGIAVIAISGFMTVMVILCLALAIAGIVICSKRRGMHTLLALNCVGIFVPIFGLVCGPIAIHTRNEYALWTHTPTPT